MDAKPKQTEQIRQLYQELTDLRLRIALAELEYEESAEHRATPDILSPDAQSEFNAHAKNAIRREFRKLAADHFWHVALPRAGKFAAAALVMIFIGISSTVAAIATVPAFRVKLMEFIIESYPERTHFELREIPEGIAEIPAEWQGYYYPTYIPEGFTLQAVNLFPNEAYYFNSAGDRFYFVESDENVSTSIDTEGAELSYITINGSKALVSEKLGRTHIVWAVGNRYFEVGLEGNRDNAIKIAESVIMFK